MRQLFTVFLPLLLLLTAACQSEPPPPSAINQPPPTGAPTGTTPPQPTAPPLPSPTAAAPTAETAAETAGEPAAPTAEPTATLPPTATPIVAAPVDTANLQPLFQGFVKPLGVEHAGDERLFILTQPGQIYVIRDGDVVPEPFLAIADRVNDQSNEQGLLGLAFHPDYAANGRFFLNYSGPRGETVIAEYRVSGDNPDRADPASERILLTIPQPYPNHNGGQIRFGPDGYLYIGMGDGGSQGDPLNAGQDPNNLLGSILRIDVDGGEPYGIPADNPYVASGDGRPEIWAKGLRNPWRFSFDRLTGDLFIADVGQNEWEEISFQPAGSPGGENYGWRIFEGTHCYTGDCSTPGLTPPIVEYSHAGGHCSVTGGFIYRGEAFPALYGNYFYADYCSGTMWRLFQNPDGSWSEATIGRTGFLVSSFGEDASGEIYVVSQNEGIIYRLTP